MESIHCVQDSDSRPIPNFGVPIGESSGDISNSHLEYLSHHHADDSNTSHANSRGNVEEFLDCEGDGRDEMQEVANSSAEDNLNADNGAHQQLPSSQPDQLYPFPLTSTSSAMREASVIETVAHSHGQSIHPTAYEHLSSVNPLGVIGMPNQNFSSPPIINSALPGCQQLSNMPIGPAGGLQPPPPYYAFPSSSLMVNGADLGAYFHTQPLNE